MAKKKNKKEAETTVLENVNITELVEVKEEGAIATFTKQSEEKTSKAKSEEQSMLEDLAELARLLGDTLDGLKKEFYLTQIKKIMSRVQKTLVRYDMTETEMQKIFSSANQYGLGGITVAPAYMPNSVKQIKKCKAKINLCSIIDFPFGESSFKAKRSDVKESLKRGANTIAVAMSSMMFNPENLKTLKKQCKAFCRANKKGAGIVINATDLNEKSYANATKYLNKTKLAFVTLAFGDATKEEVKNKLESLNSCGLTKKIYVLANIDNVDSIVEMFRYNVDCVLTPYADDIGNDLLKRFRLI